MDKVKPSGELEAVEARAREEADLFLNSDAWAEAEIGGDVEKELLAQKLADFSLAENAELQSKLNAVIVLLRAKCSDQEWEAMPTELSSVLPAEVVKLREALQQAQDDFDEIYVLPLNSLRIKLVATLASDRIESALNPGAAKEGNDALE